ncbi:helix-turn-helix domain-containing protein [Nonomuraea sp. B12E4]|uniref:winged helix-turn-helix transcriptional regulator n=1 Tax=Nonomuraea sp. B12E4 TaxID=3153564 RepID=UPI00325E7A03
MTHQAVGYAQDGPLGACLGPAVEPNPDCPVEVTLATLRGRWTPLVLLEFLRNGERSYSELAAALSRLSDKVLSDRLAQLTEAGVIERHRTPSWPPRVTYTLTERGRALAPVLETLWSWGAAESP